MSKDKNKDKTSAQAGSIGRLTGFKKYTRILATTVLVVVFIGGGITALYKKIHKPKAVAALSETLKLDLTQIPGWWSQQYFGSAVCEQENCKPDADPDNDKLNNLQEFYYHTNPLNSFTVKDSLNDGELVAAGFDPSKEGRMTFEDAASPAVLMGESLVFDKDIQTMVADSKDIGKVILPLVQDDQIKITYDEADETYTTYTNNIHAAFDKYFPSQSMASILEVIKSGSDTEAMDIRLRAQALASELQMISVPVRMLTFHKYNIALFQLIPQIIAPPTTMGPESDAWFEKVQQFLAVQQKLDFEVQNLKRGQQPTP